jgi:hypothetical protein
MEAICSSEMPVDFQRTTRHYIPEDNQSSALSWFLSCLIFLPWGIRQHVPPKRQLTFNGQQAVASQKTEPFIPFMHIFFVMCLFNGFIFLSTCLLFDLSGYISPRTSRRRLYCSCSNFEHVTVIDPPISSLSRTVLVEILVINLTLQIVFVGQVRKNCYPPYCNSSS